MNSGEFPGWKDERACKIGNADGSVADIGCIFMLGNKLSRICAQSKRNNGVNNKTTESLLLYET